MGGRAHNFQPAAAICALRKAFIQFVGMTPESVRLAARLSSLNR